MAGERSGGEPRDLPAVRNGHQQSRSCCRERAKKNSSECPAMEAVCMGFDRESLKLQLDRLPTRHRVAFAAACCERLLPNYIAFSSEVGWGEPGALRIATDYVWDVLDGATVVRDEVELLTARCNAIIPDTDDFTTESVSAALDAGVAIVETLQALIDADSDRIAGIASLCIDTVDMYVKSRDDLDYNSDPLFESRIAKDPLMERELARQSETLSALMNAPVLERTFLRRLRADSADGGRSNIGRTS
jgi:uncharacterized protein YjaG (DUF416 family)